MLQETVARLLPHLRTDGVFGLLRLLEKLGYFLKAGVGFLLPFLGVLDVVEEKPVGFVVDFLRRALGFGVDVSLEGTNPVDLLFAHEFK